MFKKILLVSLFFSVQLPAQTVYQATIAIGTAGNDGGNALIQTVDNGFAITGYSSCSGCPADAYIMRLDSSGKLNWATTIGGSNDDYGYSMAQTNDGGFVVSGYTSSYGANGGGIYIFKVNASGKLLWSKTIEGQKGYSIVQTTDNGFAVAGYTQGCSPCPTKAYVLKLDSTGNIMWGETIGGTSRDTAYSIIQTNDGGYAVAGVTSSFGAGGNDMYILKLNSAGKIQWSKTIGGTVNDEAYSIVQTHDNGFAIAGATNSYGAGGSDVYVVKTDSAGNIKWTRTLGGSTDDIARTVKETSDYGLVVAGSTANIGKKEIYVVKLDSAGNFRWCTANRSGVAYANASILTKENGYAVTGITSFFGAGGNDVLFMLLDTGGVTCISTYTSKRITSIDSGRVGTGGTANSYTPIVSIDTSNAGTAGVDTVYCINSTPTIVNNIKPVDNSIQLFPNPASDKVTLKYYADNPCPVVIAITDISGKTISTYTFKVHNGMNLYTLNTSLLSTGMYIMQISTSKQTFFRKIVKQ